MIAAELTREAEASYEKTIETDSTQQCKRITYRVRGWRTSGPQTPALKLVAIGNDIEIEKAILFRDDIEEPYDNRAARNLADALIAIAGDAERLQKKRSRA